MRVETKNRFRFQTRKTVVSEPLTGVRVRVFKRNWLWVKGFLHVTSTSSPGLDERSAQFQVFFPIV